MKILKKIIVGILLLLFLLDLVFIVALLGVPCGNTREDFNFSILIGIVLLLLIALIRNIRFDGQK